jgi:hypothetical protein
MTLVAPPVQALWTEYSICVIPDARYCRDYALSFFTTPVDSSVTGQSLRKRSRMLGGEWDNDAFSAKLTRTIIIVRGEVVEQIRWDPSENTYNAGENILKHKLRHVPSPTYSTSSSLAALPEIPHFVLFSIVGFSFPEVDLEVHCDEGSLFHGRGNAAAINLLWWARWQQ